MSLVSGAPARAYTPDDARAAYGTQLRHLTTRDRVNLILREDLRPSDEIAHGPCQHGWDRPRPGCVYLAAPSNRRRLLTGAAPALLGSDVEPGR